MITKYHLVYTLYLWFLGAELNDAAAQVAKETYFGKFVLFMIPEVLLMLLTAPCWTDQLSHQRLG